MKKCCSTLWTNLFSLVIIAGITVAPQAREEIDLTELSLQELLEVEYTLSDVFDIFDALVKMKKVRIATGAEQSAARAPAVTSVITAQDIEATGATDIDEVLETVPGLHVARGGLVSYNPIYAIRGMSSSSHILMMINGIPVNTLYTGGRNYVWGGMPVSGISRIEVIRGPGSAIFGADAFSGVINIITKTGEEINGTELGTRAGSFSTRDAWILHGGKPAGFNLAFSLEYRGTDGHGEIIDADAQTAFDRQFAQFGMPPVSLAPDEVNLQRRNLISRMDISRGNWRLRLGYQRDRDIAMGISPSQALDPSALNDDDHFNTDLSYHNPRLIKNWDVAMQFSYLDMVTETVRDSIFYPPGAFGGAYPEGMIGNLKIAERQTRLNLSAFYTGLENHTIRLGAGCYYGDVYEVGHFANTDPVTGIPLPPDNGVLDFSDTPYTFLPEKTRSSKHVFLQDGWAFAPDWEFTGGLRYDEYSDFGSTLNPRLSLVWQARPDLTAKLLYGRAFRAPAFSDLYTSSNLVVLGNPDLEAETIDTAEAALDYQAGENLHLAFNLFGYRWRDAIFFVPDPGSSTATAQNTGEQTGYGAELELRWRATKNFSLLGNYAMQYAEDKSVHTAAKAVPQHSVYLRGDWMIVPKWYLNAQLNRIGERKRAFNDPRPALDAYTTVDLTLRYKSIERNDWNFALSVRNLFDADAREPSNGPDMQGIIGIPNDLPLAGRSYFTELRYRF
ncbi:MAG: TonB-dependent receptor [Gammaproteobacteria bacterium]|nr:TonB-dependent receptor [Gammaproteobacteria bacterium]